VQPNPLDGDHTFSQLRNLKTKGDSIVADSGRNNQSLSHCLGVIQRPTTIMMSAESTDSQNKSFLISGDHPVGLICGNHMMTYTVAGNSNASAQSCQSVKRSCPDVSTYALFKRQLMESIERPSFWITYLHRSFLIKGDAVRLFHSGNNIRLLYGTEW
ncbi:hypothetical protein Tco_0700284, partial [Tanacetum coccineum]